MFRRLVRVPLSVAALTAGLAAGSCQDPTEITLEISTDVDCANVTETSITTGARGATETKAPGTITDRCAGGRIGSLVLVPSGSDNGDVGLRVVTGVGKTAEACVRDGYKRNADDSPNAGCIVARRELAYVPNTPLNLPIRMDRDCIDVPCDERAHETCVSGRCGSATAICEGRSCDVRKPTGDAGAGGAGGRGNVDASVDGPVGSGGRDASAETGTEVPDGSDCVPVAARLTNLAVSDSELSLGFDPCVRDYAVSVNLPVNKLTFTPTAARSDATVRVNGTVVASGTGSVPIVLDLGKNTVSVEVTSAAGAVATYTVVVDRTTTMPQGVQVTGSPAIPPSGYGASLALSGDTLVVGMPEEGGIDGGLGGGAVSVFVRSANGWHQQAYLKASNADASDQFGIAVAIEGNTLVVGAPSECSSSRTVGGNQADNSAQESGAAYVFTRAGSTWTQQGYLKASNADVRDFFGRAVGISGDHLVVGAPGESSDAAGVNGDQDNNNRFQSGAAYVFQGSGASWTQTAYVKPSSPQAYDRFGASISVSGDAFAVGAPSVGLAVVGKQGPEPPPPIPLQIGGTDIFVRTGGVWIDEARVGPPLGVSREEFGAAVGLSGDTLAVGAPFASDGMSPFDATNEQKGGVYVFRRSSLGWGPVAYLALSTGVDLDEFGSSIGLSGNTLAIGSASVGVSVFVRSGIAWTERARVAAPLTHASSAACVALSDDSLVVQPPSFSKFPTDAGVRLTGPLYLFR